ncbi:MAG: hypothetical protein ACKVPJ_13565 [Chitinophagales bacterium]
MKNLVLSFSILLLYNTTAFSQCEFTKNTIDEFKGYSIQVTPSRPLYQKLLEGAKISFAQIDSFYYVYFTYMTSVMYSVDKGEELIFKLEDSTLMTIYSTSYEIADCSYSSNITTCTAIMSFPISKVELQTLAKKSIIKFRLYTNDGYTENETNPNKAKAAAELADCILKY